MKATLEEIEADVQRVRGRVSPMQDATWTALKSILGLVAHDGERITALEAKVAALAGPVIPVDLSEIHAELDRLRAENAELRKHVDVMCRDCRDEYNRRMRGK